MIYLKNFKIYDFFYDGPQKITISVKDVVFYDSTCDLILFKHLVTYNKSFDNHFKLLAITYHILFEDVFGPSD